MNAVLDPNVLVSALLSPEGSPARLLRLWLEGGYELVCSPQLLEELARALAYPRLRKRIHPDEADELVALLRGGAIVVDDPEVSLGVSSSDPDDDYLIALAQESRSALVSEDRDLLDLAGQIPVYSPSQFLKLIASDH